jgi:uncharacterized membrane protein YqgA involved in biofilm formation
MKGFIVNTLLVAGGGIVGTFGCNKINDDVKDAVFNVLGLLTLFFGIKMCIACNKVVPVVICMTLGTLLGSIIDLEGRVNDRLESLRDSFLSGRGNIEGFVTASILFCMGSMAIVGSIKDGLYNDWALIKTKSIIDGFSAMLLATKYGISIIFSAVTVFIIQGLLTFLSKYMTFLISSSMVSYIDGAGGIIVIAISFNLLNLKQIKTLNMLPSLLLIILYGIWFS